MHTLRKIAVFGSSAALLLGANLALAEDKPAVVRAKQLIEERVEKRGEVKSVRQEIKKEVKDAREDARLKVSDMRAKAKQRMDEVKDKAKQQLAVRLADEIEKANKRWTDHFGDVLNQLDRLVKKIEGRGGDVAAAKTAIASARTAVAAQADKSYVLPADPTTSTTVTSTERGQTELLKSLRTGYKALHAELFADLKALRDGVMKDARKAVQTVIDSLKTSKVERGNATSTESNNN